MLGFLQILPDLYHPRSLHTMLRFLSTILDIYLSCMGFWPSSQISTCLGFCPLLMFCDLMVIPSIDKKSYLLNSIIHFIKLTVSLNFVFIPFSAMKSLRKLNLNSTNLSALTFEGLKVRNNLQWNSLDILTLFANQHILRWWIFTFFLSHQYLWRGGEFTVPFLYDFLWNWIYSNKN